MHCACKGGHEEIVKLLIEKGAETDESNEFFHTTLQVAVKGGNERVVELLLDNGSQLEEAGKGGTTALHFAA